MYRIPGYLYQGGDCAIRNHPGRGRCEYDILGYCGRWGRKETQPSQNLVEIREVTEDYWDAWTVMLCYVVLSSNILGWVTMYRYMYM